MNAVEKKIGTLWDKVLEKIEKQLNNTSFQTWFMRLNLIRIDDNLSKIRPSSPGLPPPPKAVSSREIGRASCRERV